jgi:hypothetical protein
MNILLTITFALRSWSDGPKYVLIDPEIYTPEVSTLLMKELDKTFREYNVMGSYGRAIEWVKNFPSSIGCIVVISNRGIADDMKLIRPDLDIRKIEIKEGITNE